MPNEIKLYVAPSDGNGKRLVSATGSTGEFGERNAPATSSGVATNAVPSIRNTCLRVARGRRRNQRRLVPSMPPNGMLASKTAAGKRCRTRYRCSMAPPMLCATTAGVGSTAAMVSARQST